MPYIATVKIELRDNDTFAAQYARARMCASWGSVNEKENMLRGEDPKRHPLPV